MAPPPGSRKHHWSHVVALAVALCGPPVVAGTEDAGTPDGDPWTQDPRTAKTSDQCAKVPRCELGPKCDYRCPSRLSVLGVYIDMPESQVLATLKKKKAKRLEKIGGTIFVLATSAQVDRWKLVEEAGTLMGHNPGLRIEVKDGVVATITVPSEIVPEKAGKAIGQAMNPIGSPIYMVMREQPVAEIQQKTTYLSGRTAVTGSTMIRQTMLSMFAPDVPIIVSKFKFRDEDLDGEEYQIVSEADWPKLLAQLKETVGPRYYFGNGNPAARSLAECNAARERELSHRKEVARAEAAQACDHAASMERSAQQQLDGCRRDCSRVKQYLSARHAEVERCKTQPSQGSWDPVEECREEWTYRGTTGPADETSDCPADKQR